MPGGVQGLDRYAYVNNSPVNYVDPSGHFTMTAITNYISGQCATSTGYNSETGEGAQAYSNCVTSTLATWQADTEWWSMITKAKTGDILVGYSCPAGIASSNFCSRTLYEFRGDGNTLLTGITSYNGEGDNTVSLIDIQRGTSDPSQGFFRTAPDLGWLGLIRFDNNNMPTVWRRPGVNMYQQDGFKSLNRDLIGLIWNGAVAGLFMIATSGMGTSYVVGGTIVGTAEGYFGQPILFDALNIEEGDKTVCWGAYCVVFQENNANPMTGDPGTGYYIEPLE